MLRCARPCASTTWRYRCGTRPARAASTRGSSEFAAGPAQRYPDGVLIVRNAEGFDLALGPGGDAPPAPAPFFHFGFRVPTLAARAHGAGDPPGDLGGAGAGAPLRAGGRRGEDGRPYLRPQGWPTRATAAGGGGPRAAAQMPVPAQQRGRPDGQPPPLGTRKTAAARDQEQAVARPPAGALGLPAQDRPLVPEGRQFNRRRGRRRGAGQGEFSGASGRAWSRR